MLAKRYAAVIGIDRYKDGIAPLQSAVADAREVAAALERDHGYASPHVLLDGAATGAAILRLLEETLPAAVGASAVTESSVVLYYAGHGVALGDGREGPEGFLLPQDAQPGDEGTWLSMDRVRQALARLPCRHLLVVLDCCFAGSFRWAASRSFVPVGRPLYDSQYARFLAGTAWQVLTSASHQEKALDVAPGSRNTRGGDGASHSPFAAALLRGLAGQADSTRGDYEPDGVMTATELHQFIFEELVPLGARPRQTPGLWPLKPDNTGEFLFGVPGRQTRTRPDPPLDDANNPWLGLRAYGSEDAPSFFGRKRVVEAVLDRLLDPAHPPLLAVVGASGTGKSSVVRAGVLPRLEKPSEDQKARIGEWTVTHMARLQGDPRLQLGQAFSSFTGAPSGRRLLFIDQFEELFTQCPDATVRQGFLRQLRDLMSGESPVRVVLTLRSDFEPRLAASEELGPLLAAGRYLVPAMTSEEDFREVIEEPAKLKALYFEPEALVGELVDEVQAMPGGLPLLSFALAETYRQAQLRRRATGALDRALTRGDFASAGGVVGALHRRADELYEAADPERRETIRRVFLRMVSYEGGRLARRRVEKRELEYGEDEEPARVQRVLDDYVQARLLVADGGWVEPAHDTLVLAWDKLLGWSAERGSQELARQLWSAAAAWDAARREKGDKGALGLLWNQDPRLPLGPARGDLNQIEREFMERSVARKRNRRILAAGIAAAVYLVLSGLTAYAFKQAKVAEEQRTRALDTLRVSVAGEWLPKDPTRAALVLLEVQKPDEAAFSTARLRSALGKRLPDQEVTISPGEQIVALSTDGKRFLKASENGDVTVVSVDGTSKPVLRGHGEKVAGAELSPDGQRMLIAYADGTARVARADGVGESVILKGDGTELTGAELSSDGRRLVTLSESGSVRVWSGDGSGDPLELQGHEGGVNSVDLSPDGKLAITASEDGTARVWPVGEARSPTVLRGHSGPVWGAELSADGKRAVTFSEDGSVRVWAADGSGTPVTLRGAKGRLSAARFSPDGTLVVAASDDQTALVWKADGSAEPHVLRHDDLVTSVDFSRDGRFVVTASDDGTARVWPAEGPPLVLQHSFDEEMLGAFGTPEGQHVVTVSEHRVRVWPLSSWVDPLVLDGGSWALGPVFSPDGKSVLTDSGVPAELRVQEDASGGRGYTPRSGNTALIWPLDGSAPTVLRGHESDLLSLSFSPDPEGKRVLTASKDGTARVWRADGKGTPVVLRSHAGAVTHAVFSPDGTLVLTVSEDGMARLWRADGSGEPRILRGHVGKVVDAEFSPDGKHIVTASEDKTARVWPTNGSGSSVVLRGHTAGLTTAVFSPDGWDILTASEDATARLWPAHGSGEPLVLSGHRAGVVDAKFSPDGKWSVTAAKDNTARLWEGFSVTPVILQGHIGWLRNASFSHDGKRILTTAHDGTVRVWSADGHGAPLVLAAGFPSSKASFSPDGNFVVTASETTQVWAVSGTALQGLIRTATGVCLEPDFRVSYLGETELEALATDMRCQICTRLWRKEWNARAVRAAPDEAWAEWRKCMGGGSIF